MRLALSTGLGAADMAADIVNAAVGSVVAEAHDTPLAAAPDRSPPPAAEARRARRTAVAALAADGPCEALATLLDAGLRPLGVQEVYLWRRTGTGCLELVGQAGASVPEAEHWQWLPSGYAGPLHGAVTAGVPVWLPNGTPDAAPGSESGSESGPLPGAAPDGARMLLPLYREGVVAGLLLAAWREPAELDEPLRAVLTALAEPVAHVLDWVRDEQGGPPGLAALLELLEQPAAILRTAAPDTAVVEYVNPAARRAVGPVHVPAGRPAAQVFPYAHDGLVRLIARAAGGAGPQFAPCLPEDGRAPESGSLAHVRVLALALDRAAVLWDTVDSSPVLVRVLGRLERLAWFEDDLVTGRTLWSSKAYPLFGLDPAQEPVPLRLLGPWLHRRDTDTLQRMLSTLFDRRQGAQAAVRLVRPDGGVRRIQIAAEPVFTGGVPTGLAGVYQDVTAQHQAELALSASFDRLTAAEAEAALRNRVVLGLQRALLPEEPAPEALDGLEVAVRYRPAASEYRVGGDWFDVQQLPSGRVFVSVGDIAGHGIDAATAMTGLRNALRGLAFTERPPGELMGWLNDVALNSPGLPTATALCALYDRADRSLRWTAAGHLPPLLLRQGRGRFLEPPHMILLGADPGAAYEEVVTRLDPGDLLFFYTDGLVERRHEGLDESLAVLRRAAERLGADVDTQERADRLMAEVSGDTDDDTSLVVLRVR
ncbi:SpoIIE family protein phosphatase [Streptomyces sp. RerS4]|nr:SpoIIE family protein phosphatase [Streptomyces sp. RerS4]